MGRSLENIKYHHWQKKLSCNIAKAYLLFLTSLLISAVTLCHVLHNHGKKNTQTNILNFLCCQMFFQLNKRFTFFPSQWQNDYLSHFTFFSLTFPHTLLFFITFFFLFAFFYGKKNLSSLVVLMFCCISFTKICSLLTCSSIFNLMNWTFFSLDNIYEKKRGYSTVLFIQLLIVNFSYLIVLLPPIFKFLTNYTPNFLI